MNSAEIKEQRRATEVFIQFNMDKGYFTKFIDPKVLAEIVDLKDVGHKEKLFLINYYRVFSYYQKQNLDWAAVGELINETSI